MVRRGGFDIRLYVLRELRQQRNHKWLLGAGKKKLRESLIRTAVAEFCIKRLASRNLEFDVAAVTGAGVDGVERIVVGGEGVGRAVHAVFVDFGLLVRVHVAGIVIV
jgi:hypothetical protein